MSVSLIAAVALAAPAPAQKPDADPCNSRACHIRVARKQAAKKKRALLRRTRPALASWYGPGFHGNTTACGQTMSPTLQGVAHKSLPCGRRLLVCFRRCALTRVVDRGPYVGPREFDLTQALRYRIGFPNGVATIRVAGA